MLVLTRKVGEEIVIGDRIRITVVAVKKGEIRLGFEAPAEVVILRNEMLGRIGPQATAVVEGTTPPPKRARKQNR